VSEFNNQRTARLVHSHNPTNVTMPVKNRRGSAGSRAARLSLSYATLPDTHRKTIRANSYELDIARPMSAFELGSKGCNINAMGINNWHHEM
jgi:hypothetical protein